MKIFEKIIGLFCFLWCCDLVDCLLLVIKVVVYLVLDIFLIMLLVLLLCLICVFFVEKLMCIFLIVGIVFK